tara:strand:- start:219 stop:452 length:234 start_codon:yes stop_codon:yes gene_type:complete
VEELNMSKSINLEEPRQRYYRATFYHAACVDMQITIEFEAPFPRNDEIDYGELAFRAFKKEVALEHVKIRDIEPIET